jgi:hypothetical protein
MAASLPFLLKVKIAFFTYSSNPGCSEFTLCTVYHQSDDKHEDRVSFAPSSAGLLHAGNALTALELGIFGVRERIETIVGSESNGRHFLDRGQSISTSGHRAEATRPQQDLGDPD